MVKMENSRREKFESPPQNSTELQDSIENQSSENVQLAELKNPVTRGHRKKSESTDGRKRSFDTTCISYGNYFNTTEFRKRYSKQLEMLRATLEEQRNHKYIAIRPLKIIKDDSDENCSWPTRESLFPHIPPYIKFSSHDSTPNKLPSIGRKYLKWKINNFTQIVVRKTVINTGFRLITSDFSTKSEEWTGTWGGYIRSAMLKTLKSSQKVCHFAGTLQIGWKDLLWKNLQSFMFKYGTKEFGIIPQTYILPQDLQALKHNWWGKDGSGGEKWIIKPPTLTRGIGIKVLNKWMNLPKETSLVVQRYITDPFLINGSKFDLRLYVLVTSFDPLRIYIYPEGLVRFATEKYSDKDDDLENRCMHLTNCCINRQSSRYTVNEDANSCQGHEWTLSKLWDYMEHRGGNTKVLWTELKRLVIKTIISGESAIVRQCKETIQSRYNCYELLGFDVLFDQQLKPWLLEVNTSPSLQTDSPVDLYIKGPLIQTLFDIAQFHLPPQLGEYPNTPPCYDSNLYTTALLDEETYKHEYYVQMKRREDYLDDILDQLTGDDVRILTQAEDELVVKGDFERIFPTAKTCRYLNFISARYYNRLCDAWECKYVNNRQEGINRLKTLCEEKLHLKVAQQSTASKNLPNTSRATLSKQPRTSKELKRRLRNQRRKKKTKLKEKEGTPTLPSSSTQTLDNNENVLKSFLDSS